MEKLKMQTPNITEQNIEQIARLFPQVITESQDEHGKIQKAIDFDLLKQSLSSVLVDGADERYRLDWPGKKASLLKANTPITKTLRPCREESVNFDSTENVYIEGENFEVLKILQESYLGKIKMIYIDPPYNTGKDFIYKDNYTVKKADYEVELGTTDEDDNKLFKNTDTNGRFHSDWLSMMYERLIIARDLLKEDGVIFISIDDNEVHNLRGICGEIFGEENFLAELIWNRSSGAQAGHFTRSNESIITYSKNKETLPYFEDISGGTIKHGALKKISSANPESEIFFKKGTIKCEAKNIEFPIELGGSEKQYTISGKLKFIDGILSEDVTLRAGWAMKNQVISYLKGLETFDSKGQKVLRFYFNSQGILFYEKERGTFHPKTVISSTEVGGTKAGGDEIINLFGSKIMSFPKPSKLIVFLSKTILKNNDIILDFFSGSATTAHAVMKLNAEDGGSRKFIMVQLPEITDEKSEAYKAGYKTITEIGKERIRRAGKKIVEDNQDKAGIEQLDIGFRVYKTDSSNMKEVYYHPKDLTQDELFVLESNIKEDRTPDDLLTQVILNLGLELNLPIEIRKMHGNTVFIVQTNALVACFDDNIKTQIIEEIALIKPFKVVFKDASFTESKDRINLEEHFKRLSPETLITVI